MSLLCCDDSVVIAEPGDANVVIVDVEVSANDDADSRDGSVGVYGADRVALDDAVDADPIDVSFVI